MAKKKADRQYIKNGNMHKEFADGRSEIYYRWIDGESQNWTEVSDATDESVNRRRFIPMIRQSVESQLQTREDRVAVEAALDDEGVPGIDGLEDDEA